MRLTRRSFIQASAATAGVLASGCATMEPPVSAAMAPRKAKDAAPAKGAWVASTCQGCTQWCAIEIFVEEGRAVRVRGNQNSKTNHGYVCPRGHLIPQQVYDPDRIKQTMKRIPRLTPAPRFPIPDSRIRARSPVRARRACGPPPLDL